jgi:hypothetical protein
MFLAAAFALTTIVIPTAQYIRRSIHEVFQVILLEKSHGYCVLLFKNQIKRATPCVTLGVFLVGRAGLEPATNGLKVRCSTN